MSETVATSTIGQLPVDDLPMEFTYDGDLVATATVVFKGTTFIKTYTNNGTNITDISAWIAQP